MAQRKKRTRVSIEVDRVFIGSNLKEERKMFGISFVP